MYSVLPSELEELTSPRVTVNLAAAGMFLGVAGTCTAVLGSVSLDVRQLVGFSAAASAAGLGFAWTVIDAIRSYRKARALRHELLEE
jgi:hypothetical protein